MFSALNGASESRLERGIFKSAQFIPRLKSWASLGTDREEIRELRLLYRKLAEDLIPEEEPTSEEVEALDAEPKEYLSEGELTGLLKGSKLERKPRRSSSG